MKKNLLKLVVAVVVLTSVRGKAQEISDNAIGVRLSNYENLDMELSWQHKLKENTRLELDLGYKDGIYNLAATHQWVWDLKNMFNWYVGAGAVFNSDWISEYVLSASGNVGVEYKFKAPFQLALDVRPSFQLLGTFLEFNKVPLSLSARYCF
jgi:predicted nucleotidyltransferase